jgi:hypothetical protein
MPIFADTAALVRSLRRLKAIPGLAHYLPGHDQSAEGAALYQKFDDLIANIRRFHAAVKKAALEAIGKPDPQAIAVRVFVSLNLPPAPSPIIAAMTNNIILADLNAAGPMPPGRSDPVPRAGYGPRKTTPPHFSDRSNIAKSDSTNSRRRPPICSGPDSAFL